MRFQHPATRGSLPHPRSIAGHPPPPPLAPHAYGMQPMRSHTAATPAWLVQPAHHRRTQSNRASLATSTVLQPSHPPACPRITLPPGLWAAAALPPPRPPPQSRSTCTPVSCNLHLAAPLSPHRVQRARPMIISHSLVPHTPTLCTRCWGPSHPSRQPPPPTPTLIDHEG